MNRHKIKHWLIWLTILKIIVCKRKTSKNICVSIFCVMYICRKDYGQCVVALLLAISETVKRLSALRVLMQESFWWSQCSDRYWEVRWSWFARVNALCNLSRKKSREVAASLPGQFLSRRCFTLCTTKEAESIVAKQYKCRHCCSCKNYWGKGMAGGKNVSLCRFLADQKISSSGLQKCL